MKPGFALGTGAAFLLAEALGGISQVACGGAMLLAQSTPLQSGAVPAAQSAPVQTQEAARDPAPEFADLFDGRSLQGWKVFTTDTSGNGPFSAQDGMLTCAGNPVGYIETVKEYANFELALEWRFDPSKGAGNSGVLLRVVGPDTVWPKSIEAQLHSQNAGDIWNIGEFPMKADAGRTSGRRTTKALPCNEKPLGEWNTYRIVMDQGSLKLFVNGELQNEATGCQVVAGRIGLQSEGSFIQFRNIKLKDLDPPKAK